MEIELKSRKPRVHREQPATFATAAEAGKYKVDLLMKALDKIDPDVFKKLGSR